VSESERRDCRRHRLEIQVNNRDNNRSLSGNHSDCTKGKKKMHPAHARRREGAREGREERSVEIAARRSMAGCLIVITQGHSSARRLFDSATMRG